MGDIIAHDPRFNSLIIGHARLETLWTGSRWAEGPAYFPAGRYLVWSDIPNDRLMRFDETDGSVSVFRQPSGNANGNTTDRQGRLVTCEHLHRRVTRTEHDGSISMLADQFEGKRLNSPNDVVVKSDGSIWFTDPTYGIDSDYEGDAARSEIGASFLYRLSPDGDLSVVARDRVQPNGLAFSPDETTLYVVDTGASHRPGLPVTIHSYPVIDDGAALGRPRLLATCPKGYFDGMRCDVHGNIWTSAGQAVFCYAADGVHLGTIEIGEIVANLCFGGIKRNRLYVCAQTSLYGLFLNTRGAA
jgi:gluconolactonase